MLILQGNGDLILSDAGRLFAGNVLVAFGDSITQGYNSTNHLTTAYVPLIGAAANLTVINNGFSGDMIGDQADSILATTVNSGYIYTYALGTNDERIYSTSTNKLQDFKSAHLSTVAYLAIEDARKIKGISGSVTYTGTWATDAYLIGKFATTNGSTATFSVRGRTVLIGYWKYYGSYTGSMSVTVDGVNKGSYSITPTAGEDITTGHGRAYIPALFIVSGLSDGNHTVVLTATVGDFIPFDWAAGVDYDLLGPKVYVANIAHMTSAGYGTYGGSDDNINTYNRVIRNNVAYLASMGLNVALVDVCNVTNPATDLDTDGLHPTDAGHAKWAAAFLRVMNGLTQPRDRTGGSISIPNIVWRPDAVDFYTESSGVWAKRMGIAASGVVSFSSDVSVTGALSAGSFIGSGAGLTNILFPGIINVKDYGAIGDGTTDDTSAINTASLAASVNGKALYFPLGTYIVNPNATRLICYTGQTWFGYGRLSIIKVKNNCGDYHTVIGASSDGTAVDNFTIRDITIDQNGTGNTTCNIRVGVANTEQFALYLSNSKTIKVINVNFDVCTGINTLAISGSGCKDVDIESCFFRFKKAASTDTVAGATNSYDNSAVYIHAKRIRICNNKWLSETYSDIPGAAFEIHGPTAVATGNIVEGYSQGCWIVSPDAAGNQEIDSNINVSKNVFARVSRGVGILSATFGVGSYLRNISIIGNTISIFQNSGYHDAYWADGIFCPDSTADLDTVKISGNLIRFQSGDTRSTSTRFGGANLINHVGISCSRGGGATIVSKNIQITDNEIVNAPCAGIRVGYQLSTSILKNITIARNKIIDAGSNPNFPSGASLRAALDVSGAATDVVIEDNTAEDTSISGLNGLQSWKVYPYGTAVNYRFRNNHATVSYTTPFSTYFEAGHGVQYEQNRTQDSTLNAKEFWGTVVFRSSTGTYLSDSTVLARTDVQNTFLDGQLIATNNPSALRAVTSGGIAQLLTASTIGQAHADGAALHTFYDGISLSCTLGAFFNLGISNSYFGEILGVDRDGNRLPRRWYLPDGSNNPILALELPVGANAGKATFGGTVTAPAFVGDGSGLTNVGAGSVPMKLVRAASTGNLSLSGGSAVDGVSILAGDRVLAKNQTTPSQNGIYIAAAGSWSRAGDFDSSGEVLSGTEVFVTEGTNNGGTIWRLTTTGAITVDTTAQTYTNYIGSSEGDFIVQIALLTQVFN
jgi:lysophospholipase L1-like esterase